MWFTARDRRVSTQWPSRPPRRRPGPRDGRFRARRSGMKPAGDPPPKEGSRTTTANAPGTRDGQRPRSRPAFRANPLRSARIGPLVGGDPLPVESTTASNRGNLYRGVEHRVTGDSPTTCHGRGRYCDGRQLDSRFAHVGPSAPRTVREREAAMGPSLEAFSRAIVTPQPGESEGPRSGVPNPQGSRYTGPGRSVLDSVGHRLSPAIPPHQRRLELTAMLGAVSDAGRATRPRRARRSRTGVQIRAGTFVSVRIGGVAIGPM